ncbi:MAG: arabinan endo-1,5-alpha-L-arabinosidase [Alicyclobacillus sp.]|nr:arabinan endo-1,5-alpha-L-arabinosidase [Alicyclobacillus sp.]
MTGCGGLAGSKSSEKQGGVSVSNEEDHSAASLKGLVYDFVHDPSMIKEGGKYYLFSTGDPNGAVGGGSIQIRVSEDMVHWKYEGTVFNGIPGWIKRDIPGVVNLWAPDIHYYRGWYWLYYAASTFGSNDSIIALAVNKTLDPSSRDYKWIDKGIVIRSTESDNYNAIDPNMVIDSSGHPWLAFGSFWSGIKIVQLNPETGKPSPGSHIYSIAERPTPPDAIEAPSIIYKKPYYYLFASFDFCCRGVNSTYNIRVGRATQITGPYVDEHGKSMLDGGGTQLLASEGDMIGPGGQDVVEIGGKYYMVYHFYDADDNGNPKLQIRQVSWVNGWPRLGPILIKWPYY